MKNRSLSIALLIVGVFAVSVSFDAIYHLGVAHAQPAAIDAGVGSAIGSAAPASAPPQLVDPLADPGGFWDELKALKSTGWTALVLLGAYGLLKALAGLAGRFSFLAPLAQGRAAIAWSGAIAVVAAAFAAVVHAGTWAAVGTALITAIFAFVNFHAKPAA